MQIVLQRQLVSRVKLGDAIQWATAQSAARVFKKNRQETGNNVNRMGPSRRAAPLQVR